MIWLFKALTFLGLALLVGGAVTRRFVTPGINRSVWPLALGAALLLIGGLAEVLITLTALLGPPAPGDVLDYLTQSRQGQAVLARTALACLLLALEVQALRPWWPSGLAALALLTSVSATGHARAGGPLLLLLDVLHLAAMSAWVGAVVLLAWRPLAGWRDPAQRPAIVRASALALWSVAALVLTGTAAAVTHLPGWGALWGSTYGVALLVKLGVFGAVLALAYVNRQFLMRLARTSPLRLAMRWETLFLTGVLVASGVLGTTEPPDPPRQSVRTPVSVQLGGVQVRGQLTTDPLGYLSAQLSSSGPAPQVKLVMLDHAMPGFDIPLSGPPGRLTGRAKLWMSGRWRVDVRIGQDVAQLPVTFR